MRRKGLHLVVVFRGPFYLVFLNGEKPPRAMRMSSYKQSNDGCTLNGVVVGTELGTSHDEKPPRSTRYSHGCMTYSVESFPNCTRSGANDAGDLLFGTDDGTKLCYVGP